MCACACTGPTFRRLYRAAGGAGSQSLIYSGSFEIIKLTHLSDGERRNAKRSPGEVPAAPTPNLSCLQIAQSLHHNRWDSLSFLPLLHTNGLRRGQCPLHFYTLAHRGAARDTQVSDKRSKQAEACSVHSCGNEHQESPSDTVSGLSSPSKIFVSVDPAYLVENW